VYASSKNREEQVSAGAFPTMSMDTGSNAVTEPQAPPPKVEIKVVEKQSMKGKDAYQRYELNLPFMRVECV